jgi:MYXO-CTERM domain-containing protein
MLFHLIRSTALGMLLCLSSAAVAQTTQPAPEQPATEQTTTGQTTDTAAQAIRDDDTDFGWIGLLGLIGLAGLIRRRDTTYTTRSGTTTGTTPR